MFAPVSVVIPSYNHATFLPRAVESVLQQTSPPVELIVVDDGSTDNTREVAARFGDAIRYIHHENRGLPAARNTGLKAATARFVNFLDADDWHEPEFLERLITAAEQNPDCRWFRSSCRFVDEEANQLEFRTARPVDDLFHFLLEGGQFPVHSVLVARDLCEEVGGFDETLRSCEDWDFWLRVSHREEQSCVVPEAICCCVRQSGSMSRNFWQMFEHQHIVLNRHASQHGDCRLCRRGKRRAWRNIRANGVGHILWPNIKDAARAGRWGEAAMMGLTAVGRRPSLLLGAAVHSAATLFPGIRKLQKPVR